MKVQKALESCQAYGPPRIPLAGLCLVMHGHREYMFTQPVHVLHRACGHELSRKGHQVLSLVSDELILVRGDETNARFEGMSVGCNLIAIARSSTNLILV